MQTTTKAPRFGYPPKPAGVRFAASSIPSFPYDLYFHLLMTCPLTFPHTLAYPDNYRIHAPARASVSGRAVTGQPAERSFTNPFHQPLFEAFVPKTNS